MKQCQTIGSGGLNKIMTNDKGWIIGNMAQKIIVVILILGAAGAAGWYYFSRVHPTRIEKIITNPGAYTGKEVTVEGEVTDRTSFFGAFKFYKLKDKSGEIIVVTEKSLPEVKSTVSVRGKIDDSFPLGDRKLVVFVEVSTEKKDRKN